MTTRKLLTIYAISGLVVAFPFTIIHLLANPNDAAITPVQHVTAALANFFGPWGVTIVRLVDFPNAGLQAFSWGWAFGLTFIGALLVVLAIRVTKRPIQFGLAAFWALFAIVWFGTGLTQIASGLL